MSPKLPEFILQKYRQSLQANDKSRYHDALRLCHEADIIFKTSPLAKHIPLSEIVLRLASG